MDFETMRTFFTLSALAANAATIGLVAIGIAGRNRSTSPFEFLRGTTLWLASIVAVTWTLGSLYLSESVGLNPCTLCWYQRIAMYSLAVILPIAAFRKDNGIRLYAAVLAGIGAAIAAYHRFIQAYPQFDAGACSASGPSCSAPLILEFGFVTIPYMALSGFLLILALLWANRVNNPPSVPTSEPTDTHKSLAGNP
ncbi:MAG: disulfide bond formation protein B [Acidimicrobiia bacterium]|nr:disulfide bond formation protein B [Acidimicrobiia bacterium]